MPQITLEVNGNSVTAEVEPNVLLVEFIRRQLELTGAHVGCDTAQCGACVVHVDGKSIKSCNTLAVQCDGAKITTIEGLSEGEDLHPVQAAFHEAHGLQCGYCTPGMVMSAVDLLNHNPKPSETEIRDWLKGNICRCTGYQNIVKAIQIASGQAA